VPRFVIFDLFHTLAHGADEQRDRVNAEIATIVGVDPDAMVHAYHDTWQVRLTRWDEEQTVRILAERLGSSPSAAQVSRAAALRTDLAVRTLQSVAPATLDVLDALRRAGWRFGLVSNATAGSATAWQHTALAVRFDAAVFSCQLGVAKPDPEIYLAAVGALGGSPEQCVYVGDGADRELAGAAALGMTVIRTIEHSDTDPSWPGATISSLAELLPLLGPARDGISAGRPA
jgi:putative hydrolase of the HAD superfamily